MSAPVTTRTMSASPAKVWQVLADGWLYPLFVVGATRMRDVDVTWPAVGARLHHSVGVWPLVLDDTTEVLRCEESTLLQLHARAWPGGSADVSIRIEPEADGARVSIAEDVVKGPGRLVPPPVRHLGLHWRNTETLRRLAFLAERR